VHKPGVDGIITRYEGFDAEDERVIQLFGMRKPGISERHDWRARAKTATVLID
jgi:putative hemin transport protein